MSDRIKAWLDESQRLADQATEGPWVFHTMSEAPTITGDYADSILIAEAAPYWEPVYGLPDADGKFIVGSRTRFPQAVAALREVAKLHRRATGIHEPVDFCAECSSFHRTVLWPCPTLRAIADALGLEGDDDDQ